MAQKSESNDLNQYELQRLENIRRNEEFLHTLGILNIKQDIKQQIQIKKESEEDSSYLKERKRKIIALETSSSSSSSSKKERNGNITSVEPARRSSRLSGGTVATSPLATLSPPQDEDEESRGYADMPLESCHLDDHEFKVFVILKAWRLKTCRGLSIEPFKVFQNRTLCEIIRRRRNNPTWGTTNFDPKQCVTRIEAIEEDTEKEEKDEMDEANCVRKKEYTVADQLMMCWGVGPSKVRQDKELPGFAFGAIAILDECSAATTDTANKTSSSSSPSASSSSPSASASAVLSITELFQLSRENPNSITS